MCCFLIFFILFTKTKNAVTYVAPYAEITFTVAEDEEVKNLTDDLYDAGVIRNKLFFKTITRLKGYSNEIVLAGTYNMHTQMDINQIYDVLLFGGVMEVPESESSDPSTTVDDTASEIEVSVGSETETVE